MTNFWESSNSSTRFIERHIGIKRHDKEMMLANLGFSSLDDLVYTAVPDSIQNHTPLELPNEASENDALEELKAIMSKNKVMTNMIGMGYYGTHTPSVIQRNILENPGWYTQYTPYQSEIAQGRLEALVNFQTVVTDLTGLDIANASLLDEGTAAAEAMNLSYNVKKKTQSDVYFIADNCHPQTIAVTETRAQALGIEVCIDDPTKFNWSKKPFGVLLQYPVTDGSIVDYTGLIAEAHKSQSVVTMAVDLMALCLLKSPGELGADVAIGNAQRFGVPMGYGGPHAAFFATKDAYKRKLPGRLVGISKDKNGKLAYRLALATREQHIRRDKATSNICTAQVLLAIMSSMYAVYHGPKRLKQIAESIHAKSVILGHGLKSLGFDLGAQPWFDTIKVLVPGEAQKYLQKALDRNINIRKLDDNTLTVSVDETTSIAQIELLLSAFRSDDKNLSAEMISKECSEVIPVSMLRKDSYLSHPVFNSHHSETEMLRYIRKLESRDLSLTRSMIPLGSCTMKLNATSELQPISWPEINKIHPFVPLDQAKGYTELFNNLESWLSEITGFHSVSLQPNSGANGEYAGLLVIKKFHEEKGESHRNICLIPQSAHGTNPASAALAGFKIVIIKCDEEGNIDIDDLKAKAETHKDSLGALMITYPSTHGVFEENVIDICNLVHEKGGQVYMDGANLQAQISLCKPGDFGPDVCHMNLHKTFCIPHGGGGPGIGPIGVKQHLSPFLPNHPLVKTGGERGTGPVSAAPWGSASILPISWMYIRMTGGLGLAEATKVSILNANYIAKKLDPWYPIVYKGNEGLVAHECIIDLKQVKKDCGIDENDIAKRLMDYGFHAPTVSWPVPSSLMIEPTESEPLHEIDRFCDAMISIKKEIDQITAGTWPRDNNPLKNAPHTAEMIADDQWSYPYERSMAAFPSKQVADNKFWPIVARIDNAFGDRNLVCSCPTPELFS